MTIPSNPGPIDTHLTRLADPAALHDLLLALAPIPAAALRYAG